MNKTLSSLKTILLPVLMPLLALPATAHDIDIVQLVRDNSAAVVSVRGMGYTENNSRGIAPYHDFFPLPPGIFERIQPPQRRRRPSVSTGSGFIIGADGYILTNAHVIEEADELYVTLSDDAEYKAEVIGSDEKTDIALLKIESEQPLPVIKIGDSNLLQVGQPVVAIGSPYGLDQTVTSGIISALGRRLPREDLVPFIQTDAAINPGNSGGPLLNNNGEVIGINSQIISPVRSFSGVSFSIPINVAMDIQSKLREHGVVRRGRLGVYFAPVTEAVAEAYGLEKPQGALIQDIVENSPAEAAGMQSGDILISFEGEEIEEAFMLPRLVGNTEPGTQVEFGVFREGTTLTISATLTSSDEDSSPKILLGLEVEDLTDEMRQRSGISSGVVVRDIHLDKGVPQGISQIRSGDIITRILINQRQHQVYDRATFTALLAEVDSGAIAFSIWREGRRLIIPIRIQ